MKKNYPVPDDVAVLFEKARAARVCRDNAINSRFGSRRAIEYELESERLDIEAWGLISKLYPETRGYGLIYSFGNKSVSIRKGKS